jgi:hypothetical protein
MGSRSNQPQPLETRVSFLPDDDVVVHRDAERLRDLDDLLRHLDVRAGGRRITGGMVVQEPMILDINLISISFFVFEDNLGTLIGDGRRFHNSFLTLGHR